MAIEPRWQTVVALGSSQALSWGSSYYLPAILATRMAADLGVSETTVFGAFSLALVVSALLGPLAGRTIDRLGGRPVLLVTNVVFAAGLALLATAHGPAGLFVGWIVMGVAMGSGLYEAAFATLVRLYGHGSRNAITGITLIAGFASTVGWPLSTLFAAQFGWRGACLSWLVLHLLVGLPLNACIPRAAASALTGSPPEGPGRTKDATGMPSARNVLAAGLLAYVFAITWFVSTAMAAHLPQLLVAGGASLSVAVAAGALVGPAQVAARLLEFGVLRRFHPLLSARLAALGHPIGALLLLLGGAPLAIGFALLHGAGNGILTIAKGTLPLVYFGPHGYGARQGLLTVPARIAQALAPLAFGFCLARWGVGALWVSAGLSLTSLVALLALHGARQSEDSVARTAGGSVT